MTIGAWVMALALTAVVAGAATQRITGMGFALVCAPALVYALGPVAAVSLSNTVGVGLNISIVALTFRKLNWQKGMGIIAGAAVVIPPLALLLRKIDTAWLQMIVGVLVVVAVLMILFRRMDAPPARDTVLGRLATGAAAGAMGAAAGLSGPPLAIYAARTDWEAQEFVPTFQLIGIFIGVLAVSTAPPLVLPLDIWVKVVIAIVTGFVLGSALAPRIRSHQVQLAALIISAVGGAVTFLAGVYTILMR